MNVILDTTILTLFLKPDVVPPNDPSTGKPVERAAERIEHLINELAMSGARILIPTPVLAEFLVIADASGPDYLSVISGEAFFRVEDLDEAAAVEAGAAQRKALQTGDRTIVFAGSRQCVKTDRQIVAIAKTRNVDAIYTADADIQKMGKDSGVHVVMLWDIAPPPSQTPLFDESDYPDGKSGS